MKGSLEDLGGFQESDLLSSRAIYPDVQEIKQNGPRQVWMRRKLLANMIRKHTGE